MAAAITGAAILPNPLGLGQHIDGHGYLLLGGDGGVQPDQPHRVGLVKFGDRIP